MSTSARTRFLSYVDDMTVQSRPGGTLAVIRTSAVRASENAARLAGMFALFLGGPDTVTIELPELEAAIALTNYYLDQKLTIFRKTHVDPEMLLAEKTWNWMVERWEDPLISLRDLCHYGIPSAVRRVDAASKVIAILEREGHLVRLEGKHQVKGEFRERVWKIIQ